MQIKSPQCELNQPMWINLQSIIWKWHSPNVNGAHQCEPRQIWIKEKKYGQENKARPSQLRYSYIECVHIDDHIHLTLIYLKCVCVHIINWKLVHIGRFRSHWSLQWEKPLQTALNTRSRRPLVLRSERLPLSFSIWKKRDALQNLFKINKI